MIWQRFRFWLSMTLLRWWNWWRKPKPRVVRGHSARVYVNGVEIAQFKEISYKPVESPPSEHGFVLTQNVDHFYPKEVQASIKNWRVMQEKE